MVERVILTPKNYDIHMLNDMIINKFSGDEHILLSFDEVDGDTHNLYQQEYLHTIAPGHNAGKIAFLSRIKIKTTDGAGLPFVLIRKQFSVKLSLTITINKSQGQTIPNVGIYLPRHVFSHGQFETGDISDFDSMVDIPIKQQYHLMSLLMFMFICLINCEKCFFILILSKSSYGFE
ncbi:uncharacterized protein LOC127094232 [Lathyrus oleraceus]|uniref:uncharacterized protein LOC127094232 n=1 Tax=Pisum sativum TaxID=3888 RepID=UPI0021D31265|nr:uncharacterized protein LOC127094232 [Pisum sativum]